jgi:hypothetical protein
MSSSDMASTFYNGSLTHFGKRFLYLIGTAYSRIKGKATVNSITDIVYQNIKNIIRDLADFDCVHGNDFVSKLMPR